MSHQELSSYTWELFSGDDSSRIFYYQDSEGVAIDLSGYEADASFDVNGVYADTTGTAVTAEITDAAGGEVTVSVADTMTALWRAGVVGRFHVGLISPAELDVTIASGRVVVNP